MAILEGCNAVYDLTGTGVTGGKYQKQFSQLLSFRSSMMINYNTSEFNWEYITAQKENTVRRYNASSYQVIRECNLIISELSEGLKSMN